MVELPKPSTSEFSAAWGTSPACLTQLDCTFASVCVATSRLDRLLCMVCPASYMFADCGWLMHKGMCSNGLLCLNWHDGLAHQASRNSSWADQAHQHDFQKWL